MAASFNNFIWACYRSRFSPNVGFHYDRWRNASIELEKSGVFSKFMKIPLDREVLELPCAYKYIIGNTLSQNNANISQGKDLIDELYIPMMVLEQDATDVKSSNPMLKKFFYETDPGHNLAIKKAGDTKYLGGEGIILYEDFTPLIMFTLEVTRIKNNRGLYNYEPTKQIIRINPIVYNNDDILAKYIRTKLISNVLLLRDYSGYYSYAKLKNESGVFTKRELPWTFKIVIEDFSYFFESPSIPNTTFNNEDINNLLKDNLDSILSGI